MIEIKKILVAIDFSEYSEQCCAVAQKMASTFGATVDFIHIIPTTKYLNESLKKIGVPIDLAGDIYPKIIKESKKQAEETLNRTIKEENRGACIVKVERKPSDAIVSYAEKNNYSLIIIGARGSHETSHLRGGTTEKVVRNSHIPVFCVQESFDPGKVRNILVPSDSSSFSFSSFPLAVAIAGMNGADITLFHVMELYGSISEDIPRNPEKGEYLSIYETLIERLNTYLSDTNNDITIKRTADPYEDQIVITIGDQQKTLTLFTKIEKGVSAHFQIENYADTHADLVIITTHGHSGLAHLFLGSTAEKVVRHITRPVITVRPEKEKNR